PSRQTRMSENSRLSASADSHLPSSLSGTHTAWVTPHSNRAATTEGPSSMVCTGRNKAGAADVWDRPGLTIAIIAGLFAFMQGMTSHAVGGFLQFCSIAGLGRGHEGASLVLPVRRFTAGRGVFAECGEQHNELSLLAV